MIVREFDLSWPRQVNDALQAFSILSSSQEIFLSLDCYLNMSTFSHLTRILPSFYLKVLLFGLIPIMFGLISTVIWILIGFLMKKLRDREIDVRLNIEVTFFIIVFIAYPSITTLSFSLFNCQRIDNQSYYLRRDFSI